MRKAALSIICILLITSSCVNKITGPIVTDHELIKALYSQFESFYNTGNRDRLMKLFSVRFLHNGIDKEFVEIILSDGPNALNITNIHIKLKGIYAECSFVITVEWENGEESVEFTPGFDPLGFCFLRKDPAEWGFYGNQEEGDVQVVQDSWDFNK